MARPRQTNNCKNENIRIDFFGRLLTFTPDNGRLNIRTMLHALKQAPAAGHEPEGSPRKAPLSR